MIALGLTVELIAAGLVVAGLVVGEAHATAPLWGAVAVGLLGLAIAMVGVARARPPLRPLATGVRPGGG